MKNTVLAFEWKRENIFTKEGKNLVASWKKSFIGLTENEVKAKLMEDMKTYNIWAIDVYRSTDNWCKYIYVNFGNFCIEFDKHTRKVVYAH